MNKSIALLIIGVISLAMFLIMLNQFATTSTPPPLVGVQNPLPQSGIPNSAALSPPNAPPLAPSQVPTYKAPATGAVSTPPAPATTSSPLSSLAPSTHSSPVLNNPDTKTRPAQEPASTAPAPSSKSKAQAPVKESTPQAAPTPQVSAKPVPTKSTPAQSAPVKSTPAKAAAPKNIEKISVRAAGEGATVRIDGNNTLAYKTMHLKDPDRIVVDLEGVWAIKAPGVPANKVVKNVRIGKQSNKTRIVIDLSRSPAGITFIKISDEILDVRIK